MIEWIIEMTQIDGRFFFGFNFRFQLKVKDRFKKVEHKFLAICTPFTAAVEFPILHCPRREDQSAGIQVLIGIIKFEVGL